MPNEGHSTIHKTVRFYDDSQSAVQGQTAGNRKNQMPRGNS